MISFYGDNVLGRVGKRKMLVYLPKKEKPYSNSFNSKQHITIKQRRVNVESEMLEWRCLAVTRCFSDL